jgi:hypothetical protein
VREHRLRSRVLLRPQFSHKRDFDSLTPVALVPYRRFDPEAGE